MFDYVTLFFYLSMSESFILSPCCWCYSCHCSLVLLCWPAFIYIYLSAPCSHSLLSLWACEHIILLVCVSEAEPFPCSCAFPACTPERSWVNIHLHSIWWLLTHYLKQKIFLGQIVAATVVVKLSSLCSVVVSVRESVFPLCKCLLPWPTCEEKSMLEKQTVERHTLEVFFFPEMNFIYSKKKLLLVFCVWVQFSFCLKHLSINMDSTDINSIKKTLISQWVPQHLSKQQQVNLQEMAHMGGMLQSVFTISSFSTRLLLLMGWPSTSICTGPPHQRSHVNNPFQL